jgi:hypothetical protein
VLMTYVGLWAVCVRLRDLVGPGLGEAALNSVAVLKAMARSCGLECALLPWCTTVPVVATY